MSKQKRKKSSEVKQRFFVSGMHCASCEVLIEKTLIERKGVEYVEASLAGGTLDIRFDPKRVTISPDMLSKTFQDLGYTFSNTKNNTSKQQKKSSTLLYLGSAVAILVLFVFFEKAKFGQFISVDATSSLPAFFVFGLVAGMSSCAALVGGIVLSMTKRWHEQYITASSVKKMQPHILFHVGRVVAYVLGGGLLGAVGSAITFQNVTVYAVLILVISIVMIILGLQMLGVPWVSRARLGMPKFLSRFSAEEKNTSRAPLLLGGATLFLPCGFTLAVEGVALISGSFLSGALIMGVFSLGTLPVLLAISMSGVYMNSKPHLTARFNIMAGVLVLFFGFYNINAQMNVLGLPSLTPKAHVGGQNGESVTEAKTVQMKGKSNDGAEEQTLEIVARDFEYIPSSVPSLKAGVKTTLIVDNQGVLGCARSMAARGLFPGWLDLKPGKNTITFTPKKGTYKLTCTMGMVAPVVITVK